MSDAMSPVQDGEAEHVRDEMALCLSGGGYRAMLFHLGALWRLNEVGYLPRLVRVSSVSGGSMTNGALALAWKRLAFDEKGVARNFDAEVEQPIRKLAGKTIDLWAIVLGLLLPGPIGNWYARGLRRNLLGDATLEDVPGEGVPGDPRFVFNAANLQSAVLWRFSHPYMRDYRVGMIEKPKVELATAVAASGAFPPFLAPVKLEPNPADWTPMTGHDLQFA